MEQTSAAIDPNDLLIFARVAELGSFSRAAEQLGLPKSTVSRRLAGLEQRVGERLLLRSTRRQTLTEFGLQLLEHARSVAAEVAAVTALSEHRQAEPSGRLRVSMPSDFANLLLADQLAAFLALHPAIALELDLSPRRVDLIGEGFDLALRMGDLPDDALLAARRLTTFPAGLYASPDYLAEHGDPAAPDDLTHHRALHLRRGNGEPAPWLLQRGGQGPGERWQGVPPGALSANSPELLLRLARKGIGIAALPDYFVTPEVRQGALRRVLPDWCLPSHAAWAVFPGRKLMPAKTRVFIDMLQAALAGCSGAAGCQGRGSLEAGGGAAGVEAG
ncbi:MAG TPA: LysR family transcriptional regulator [Burkholderiaceae bacterium]|nr:LysR family transcriptional regulator [Burkholderiaceae bacterium]HNB44964.1 LysR family transcriptional regulator [Burkholderiaceae bacterium]HNG82039.1 LysR family transcriptional regulator [Burkholderiaceae bacterium]